MNAADQRSVRKAGQAARLQDKREQDDLAFVMSEHAGRRFVWKLLTKAGVFRTSYVSGSFDLTAMNEGRRSMGLELMAEIHQLDPSYYLSMAQEAAMAERQAAHTNQEDQTHE